jgi:hypothetical protein
MTGKKLIQALLVGAMGYVFQHISLWFMMGSSYLYFSGISLFGSLVGIYASLLGLNILCGFSAMRWFLLQGFISPATCLSVYHIPTQLAALYWYALRTSKRVRVLFALIPLSCIVLFGLHSEGRQAMAYTLYWFIPALTLIIPHNSRWLHALGSTFTAHAVGSVIWIWTHSSMAAALWLGLIPVVACERILFATGIWAISYAVDAVAQLMKESAKNSQIFSTEASQ